MTRVAMGLVTTAGAVLLLLLAGCQPTPEERMSNAQQYFADGDYRTAGIELRNVLQADPDNAQARLLLARSAYQVGDFATSVSQFERALGLGEITPDVWVGFGRSLLSQGRVQDALERVIPNLTLNSDDESEDILAGDILFALNNYAGAKSHYARAAEINRGSDRAAVGMALVLAAEGDKDEARRIFDSAAKDSPASSFVWLARGNFHRSDRDYTAAAAAYEKSLSLETETTPLAEHFSASVSLVSTLLDSRQTDAAATHLEKLAKAFPGHPATGFLSGRLAFEQGDYEAAQLQLQDYLSMNPGDARGLAILGAVNFSQDNLRQAEIYLMNAVRANAGGDATRQLLAETRLRLSDPEGALEALRGTSPLEQSDAMYFSMLGRAQIAIGDTDAAIRYFEQSIEKQPGNVAVGLALATAYLKEDRAQSAIDLLESIPQQAGSELRRQTMLIAALIKSGSNDRAIAESNRLIGDRPNDPSAYVVAGAMRQSLGEMDRARGHFQQALDIDPDNLSALFSLSRLAMAENNLAVARSDLQRLLAVHPAYMPAIVSLGMVLQRSGELANLRQYLAAAIDKSPQLLAPYVVLARLELALGQPDAALKVVANARDHFKDKVELDHLQGLALLVTGDNSQALRSLLAAAAGAPDNEAYQFDLAQAQLANKLYREAFETARRFADLSPKDARGPALLVDAAIRMGTPDKAREFVDAFASAYPEHPDIEVLQGDLALAGGSPKDALRHFEAAAARNWNRTIALRLARANVQAGTGKGSVPVSRWLREHPDDDEVRYTYAQLLETEGKTVQAIAEYELLLRQGKLNALGMNNLAWHVAPVDSERAVSLAEEAHSLLPENGNITDTLGWILAEKGELERALPLLRQAASQEPGNAEIRFHLASVLAQTGAREEARTLIDELLRSGEPFPSRPDAEQLAPTL